MQLIAQPVRPDTPLDCPVCGRELGFEQHRTHTPFTVQHRWLIYRLADMGIGHKAIARIIHSTGNTIGVLLSERHRRTP